MSAGFSASLLFAVFLSFSFYTPPVLAEDLIVVEVQVNTVPQEDLFVYLQDDGDFLVRDIDLKAMGIGRGPGQVAVREGEEFVSLNSIEGVVFEFNEESLSLQVTADPRLLPVAVVDMMPKQKQKVYYPDEDSFFFNYGFDYEAGTLPDEGFQLLNLNVSNELGIRKRDLLFFTDSYYHRGAEESRFVRLNTNLTHDQRERMCRIVVGDTAAYSGELGSRINFAGVSFSKNFQIDPYFLENPFFNYSGLLSLPSELTLYSNGIRLSREELPPGRFELRNFHNTGGAQDLELEITDSMGRVQRFSASFYFTNMLLREGVSEYSYNLGTIRKDFGLEDSRYSHGVISARHRYGVSDELTLGARSEAGNGIFNLGVESLYNFRNLGLFGLDVSGSGGEGSGWASLLRYEFRNHHYKFLLAMNHFSDEYQALERLEAERLKKNDYRVGFGYVERSFGSIALDLARTEYQEFEDESLVSLSYSRRIGRKWYLNSTLRYFDSQEANTEFYISLTYDIDREHTVTTRLRTDDHTNQQAVEVRRDIPVGEGYGWWSAIERDDTVTDEIYTFNPGGQWNLPFGIYRGEANITTENESFRVAASGGIVALGGEYGLTRPVTDSFGLAKVNDLEGVRVYVNGQETGRTGEDGLLFIPNLTSFYHNRISLEDEDIDIDYLMPQVEASISPPFRSGSCIIFPVERYQAMTGRLVADTAGGINPLEFYQGEFFGAMRAMNFFTGSSGEFYFDNDPGSIDEALLDPAAKGCAALHDISAAVFNPGIYGGRAVSESGDACLFEMKIPQTEEQYFDVGDILCVPESDLVPKANVQPIDAFGSEGTQDR